MRKSAASFWNYTTCVSRIPRIWHGEGGDLLTALPSAEPRNWLFERIYILHGQPKTDDWQWGQNHIFDDYGKLAEAITLLARTYFDGLDPNQQAAIEGRVYNNAGRPQTSDPIWGKNNVKKVSGEILLKSLFQDQPLVVSMLDQLSMAI